MNITFDGAEKITLVDYTRSKPGADRAVYECAEDETVMHCDGAKIIVTIAAYDEEDE